MIGYRLLALLQVLVLALATATAASAALGAPGKPTRPAAQANTIPADRDDVTPVRAGDPEMNAAIADAQRSLPEFLQVLAKPDPSITNVTFKYPLAGWEHIWVNQVTRDGDYLIGRLANRPIAEGFAYQQEVRVKLGEVSDWAYRDAAGVMHGHRTTRVLIGRADPAMANELRRDFRWNQAD